MDPDEDITSSFADENSYVTSEPIIINENNQAEQVKLLKSAEVIQHNWRKSFSYREAKREEFMRWNLARRVIQVCN